MAYSTIINPGDYFDTKLYTGTGSSNAQTGLGFQPDFVWIKNRTDTSNHRAFDAVRGANKRIIPNNNSAETTTTQELMSFNSNGFTVGTEQDVNGSGQNFVSWNWKANGQGSSNTDGSINTTYTSANTTSGFSIVKWNGSAGNATIGHGLGIAPELVFYKLLTTSGYYTYAKHALGSNGARGKVVVGFLENTAAFTNDTGSFQSTDPSSTLLYIGGGANQSGANIAYCFSSIKGFSKMGSYVGNANADGAFVYTGFKPAWIMIKRTSVAGDNWLMFDNKRQGYNGGSGSTEGNLNLTADQTAAEGNSSLINIVSNGFKMITSDAKINASGSTYIYAAFAETPFVSNVGESLPTTAR